MSGGLIALTVPECERLMRWFTFLLPDSEAPGDRELFDRLLEWHIRHVERESL
jgi:hypothetical protein